MATIREQIMELLTREESDARSASQTLGIKEKEFYSHLPHIMKTAAAQGKKLTGTPPKCLSCGFTFKERKRLSKPSRCPSCKSERIEAPAYRVK